MEHKDNEFNLASLSDAEVKQVNTLEKTMSDEKGEDIVLVAYRSREK